VLYPLVFLLRRRVTLRNLLLLAASYFFYACWDWRFLGLLMISTCVDFFCGIKLDLPQKEKRKKIFVLFSVCTNLSILGFFKYFNFFAENMQLLLESLGVYVQTHTLHIILPMGISFYTFQTMSYTIDCYRGKLRAERNFLTFALFLSFFPQLVAGPIERAKRLLPQMRLPSVITWNRVRSGCYLIFWGLFKKVVFADNIAGVVNDVFAAENPTGLMVLLGIYAFAFQIYCDFSGYSDIARGLARTIGFDLMLNFNFPYFATNPREFWRRWHISLSSWLRDYLYVPLGGSRKGINRLFLSLMLTMALGGLWHGASMNFVVWGLYQGTLLCVHRLLEPHLDRWVQPQRKITISLWYWLRVIVFFQFICLGWLIFRVESLSQMMMLLQALFLNFSFNLQNLSEILVLGLFATMIMLTSMQMMQKWYDDHEFLLKRSVITRGIAYTLLILGFICFGEYGGENFIYFQF